MAQNTTDQFLDKYKQLENAVRQAYGLDQNDSISHFLRSRREFSKYAERLQYCTEVRNLLQHKQKIDGSFAVQPTPQMLDFIDDLVAAVKDRPKVLDIATRADRIYYRQMSDLVKEAMHVMIEKRYTHVPIYGGGKVIGVFDENALFNYIASEGVIDIDGLRFQDMQPYLQLEGRDGFVFTFNARDLYVEELESIFEDHFRKGDRVGVAFITEHGDESESVLGMVTAYDILSGDED